MPDLLDHYPLSEGTYHEMLDADGAVRPHNTCSAAPRRS